MENEIQKGAKVEILTKDKKTISGIVKETGIRRDKDRGLMVVLKTGEIGRVTKIIDGKIKTEIESLIKRGESYSVEFKSEALWSLTYKNQDIDVSKSYELRTYKQKTSKVIIAKSINAFMNSDGGTLVIGVKENKNESGYEIVGVEKDLEKLKQIGKDSSLDGYKRMIIDEIIRPYFPYKIYNSLNKNLSIEFEKHEDVFVCLIKINPANSKVFLNLEGQKVFMIRTETESRQIRDEELVDYCMSKFR